mgnify:CR=1 FL=1
MLEAYSRKEDWGGLALILFIFIFNWGSQSQSAKHRPIVPLPVFTYIEITLLLLQQTREGTSTCKTFGIGLAALPAPVTIIKYQMLLPRWSVQYVICFLTSSSVRSPSEILE